LSGDGRVAARDAGAWLAGEDVHPDGALVSAAVRARETWAGLCEGGGFDPGVASVERALYSAGPEAVLDLVRLVDDEVRVLVVVGHNPTVSVLAMTLDDGSTTTLLDDPAYPPGTVTVLEVDGPWAGLTEQGARAVAHRTG